MPIPIAGGTKRGFCRMRHQVIPKEEDAGISPETAVRSKSPGSICVGGKRVSPTIDEVAGDVVVETKKVLKNGDVYCGDFVDNMPQGCGKYLWTDGCIYEGEWRSGKAAGKGKFSWPSGAIFEGDFMDGRMEGYGIFVGANGETYRGCWIADRKEGCGKKSYANGDFYTGQWRGGLQDGEGRYVWKNGNQYVGEWRNGVISGRGLLICTDGNRYDGHWEKGMPKRSGIFSWPDGCCYTGSCNRDQQPPSGINCVKPIAKSTDRRSSISPCFLPSRNRFSVDGASPMNGTTVKNSPRICIWDSHGDTGDITCDIVDNIEPSMPYKDVWAFCERELAVRLQRQNDCCLASFEMKKPGQTISKGHKNYDLVLNLQLGIRYSVGKLCSKQSIELCPSDFDPREKFWTRFPVGGSKITPPHNSTEFRWKDYCPNVFRYMRKLFSVDSMDYVMAICGDDSLRELSSPGKSGSSFYLTQDDRFIIKTVRKCEMKVLISMLSSYYQHFCKYEDSLITKFLGAHCVKPSGGQKVRFIVMGNVFFSEFGIHRRFDLKGSSHGRTIRKTEEKVDETTTLKDLDLDLIFHLQKPWLKKLLWQLERDCEFLETESIMDYSLLVGLHFIYDSSASKMGINSISQKKIGIDESVHSDGPLSEFYLPEIRWQDTARLIDCREPPTRLGANIPALAEHVFVEKGLIMQASKGRTHKVILYFGIIDILQDYDLSKKLEHAYKSLQVDSTSISAVDPKLYSSRFRDFIGKIFVEDE